VLNETLVVFLPLIPRSLASITRDKGLESKSFPNNLACVFRVAAQTSSKPPWEGWKWKSALCDAAIATHH
jgi:uncharacterized protein YfaA (DUF2138 family)